MVRQVVRWRRRTRRGVLLRVPLLRVVHLRRVVLLRVGVLLVVVLHVWASVMRVVSVVRRRGPDDKRCLHRRSSERRQVGRVVEARLWVHALRREDVSQRRVRRGLRQLLLARCRTRVV